MNKTMMLRTISMNDVVDAGESWRYEVVK